MIDSEENQLPFRGGTEVDVHMRVLFKSPNTDNLPNMQVLVAVMLAAFAVTLWLGVRLPGHIAHHSSYVYKELTAPNGVRLHTIITTPDNIGLKAISSNVTKTKESGINGGFFWEGELLSIAVMNDAPVRGEAGEYGSGWFNIDRPRGTLVWDGRERRFSVQITDRSEELRVSDRASYWAQGGVSMGLRNDIGWKEQALKEEFPAMEEDRLRSGMVYDQMGRIYLIVSDVPCTGTAFRDAIKEVIAPGSLVDGVFLDGDGSSQLQLDKLRLAGDDRAVYQMIVLRET